MDQAGLGATTQPATQPAAVAAETPGTADGAMRTGATELLGRFGGFLSSMMDLVAAVVVPPWRG